MIDLKDLQCLSALARKKHFARAAKECGISQPAFSMRIRKVEERLQTSIVNRGNRFQGLTDDGMLIVRHARSIMDQMKTFEQEFRSSRGEIAGHLNLGVIPTALSYAGHLMIDLNHEYPNIVVRIEAASSLAIQQGIEDGSFEAGITYTDGAPQDLLRIEPLYDEEYVLLVPERLAPRKDGDITWAEAARMPLSLLEPGMQNRRILDHVFAEAGTQPRVIAETSGFTSAIVLAVEGLAATVVPKMLVNSLGGFPGTVTLPLVDPVQTKAVCLATANRETEPPTLQALRSVAANS